MVGDGHGVHPHGLRMLRKLIQMASAVEQRELGMKMKMNKLGSGHGGGGSLAAAHCAPVVLVDACPELRSSASVEGYSYTSVEVRATSPSSPHRRLSVIPVKAGIQV